MQPFRFVHAADLHIDSPFKGLRGIADDVATRLRASTFEAFRNLIGLCIQERADFLVIAGDVYDGADRGIRAQRRFREGLTELAEHGIQTFVAHGNHDPLDTWNSRSVLPEMTHIFGPEPEWAEARRGGNGELLAHIQGVSYPTRVVEDNLALQFGPPPNGYDGFSIGVLHCNVGGNSNHDNYAPCTLEDLASVGLDYWALGHVHSPAERVLRERAPMVVYPGNTQGRHPNEPGPRGAMLIDVNAAGETRSRFVPLDVVRWETLRIDIAGLPGNDALIDRVTGEIESVRAAAAGRDLVCRVQLTGRGPLHQTLREPGNLDELREEIHLQAATGSGWTWVDDVRNETRPELDLEVLSSRDDFVGEVLRRAKSLDLESCQELLAEVFRSRNTGPDRPLERLDSTQVQAWVQDAQWYLAETLGSGGNDS
jgi:DNA repair exonuclease SbcCD nuclease subunit